MLTLKDINLLKKFFMTKEEFEDAMRIQNNNILNFKDEILTEIVELRQETTVNSSFRQKFDNHEARIQHLEKALAN
jgi:hypothetical protein